MSDAILISPTETNPAMISSALATSIMVSPALAQARSVPSRSLGSPLWDLAGAVPSLDLNFAQNRSLVDATTGLDLVTFSRTSDATFVNSQGVIQTASAGTPRFDHNPLTGESLGLLVEEQRTNSIRNNTMVGAVAGTPGTLPTNWSATTPANGITREIVGTGTEDGITYIDFRFSGTNTLGSTYYMDITLETGTITVAQGQAWTQSLYARLISGSITGASFTSAVGIVLYGLPGFNDNRGLSLLPVSNARLSSQRFVSTYTFANALTTAASPRIAWIIATGATIDFTIRIGMPQLEQGAFATSVIPTSGTAVTRAADVCSISGSNFSSWYRQDEGTVFAELVGRSVRTTLSFDRYLSINSADVGADDISFSTQTASGGGAQNKITGNVITGGVSQASLVAPGGGPDFGGKMAMALAENNVAYTIAGLMPVVDNSATLFAATQLQIMGISRFQPKGNGHVKRIVYWPQRLGNEVLQRITQ